MESEQTSLAFSLPSSPERVRANSPVEFPHDYLFLSPRARDTVSFGLDDILQTAASDSEDFGPALADAFPPSGQELWVLWSRVTPPCRWYRTLWPPTFHPLWLLFYNKNFLPPTERSDRGNTSVGHRTRVLQPLLPCSKERRRPEAHSGSVASEFFPLQREIQDADDETIMSQIQGGDWFVTIDLKDAYFYIQVTFTMAGPRFSPERGENGCDPPSPYDHDGRINDGLGRGLRRQTGERGMDRRVPFLAHKLPGTQGCLPGFVFSPRSRGASYHSQNGQYGGCIPHKPSGRFTVAHLGQACAPSSPLVPGQVPFFEGSSCSGNTEPCGRFSVETEAQAGGMDVEPSDGLCFSRVIQVPALVLPEFPDDSGHRCVRRG